MKPGYKTTEFWGGVAASGVNWLAAIAGDLPERYAAIATGIVAGAYAFSRGLAKVYPPKPGP